MYLHSTAHNPFRVHRSREPQIDEFEDCGVYDIIGKKYVDSVPGAATENQENSREIRGSTLSTAWDRPLIPRGRMQLWPLSNEGV